ncbi:MarR family transcriptional regulator [Streptomyces sp. NPDC002490]|uniref:MarR family winged helix-turn-helix transcriptional regulator n=1 Tax=Streptomyces sp. NPDC002490 TaxID=3154416 RepID=UPI003326C1B2
MTTAPSPASAPSVRSAPAGALPDRSAPDAPAPTPPPTDRPSTEPPTQRGHGPRWLDDEQQRVWQAYLSATTLLDDHLDRQLQRDAGMPHLYYGFLVQLSEAPRRRLRMTEMARNAKITRSRLSHAVARLEKSGWVTREDCPSDRRGQFAVLTDQGYEVLRRTAPGHVEAVQQALFDRLTPGQQKSLGEIMEIVAEGLQPKDAGADLPWLR